MIFSVSSRYSSVLFVLIALLALARSAAAQSLPSGWAATDVGSPARSGSVSVSGSTVTMYGGGADIWGTADQFMFVYRQLTGDGTIIARVESLQNTDAWAKAGVMMRESLSGGSRHAFALVSPGRGTAFQRRTSTNGGSSGTSSSGAPPMWLRLQRTGSSFTASRSSNGATWTTIGSQSISMAATIHVGLAVTSHKPSTLTRAVISNVSVTSSSSSTTTTSSSGSTLPSGWSSSDIGSGIPPGSAKHASGVFTVVGAGADVWGTSDQFRFTYRQVTGDVDVVARVTSVEHVDPWTKAGVMIRRSLGAGAGHASMFVSAGRGVAFQRRPADGASSVHTAAGGQTAPWWVRLSRRGSTITAYQSSNGSTWSAVGTQSLTLPSTFYVGLAVTSHDTSARATATFSNLSVTAPSSTPANQPPAVSLTSPSAGASFPAPASVTLAATASDVDGTIARVDFYAGPVLVGSDTSSPYTYTWSSVGGGTYSLTAVARDNSGASTTSAARTITVTSGNQPPMVSLSSPAAGATFTAPAAITLAATASDPDGSIARVEFYAGSTMIGSDSTAPYSVGWSNVRAGIYSLTAVARDNAGATTVSGARSITVRDPATPTQAVFVPSSNHATAVDRYVVEFFFAGSNPSVSNPVATADIGRPAVVNGEIRADVSQTITSLTPGAYIATVTAIGSGGSARSSPSPQFTR